MVEEDVAVSEWQNQGGGDKSRYIYMYMFVCVAKRPCGQQCPIRLRRRRSLI